MRISSLVRRLMVAGFAAAALTVPVMAVQPVSALNGCTGKACITDGAGKVDTGSKKTVPQIIKQVTEILLFILGAVAVIMIVVGGFKFVTSGGSPEQVKSAKNTIMYSVVGIIVAIVAWGIVDFVVKQL